MGRGQPQEGPLPTFSPRGDGPRCLQDPDRNESLDMAAFLDILTKKVKAPIMIDSTDPAVIELALKLLQGKSIINSVNLEDGEARIVSLPEDDVGPLLVERSDLLGSSEEELGT